MIKKKVIVKSEKTTVPVFISNKELEKKAAEIKAKNKQNGS